jgi:GWxTD domain-containing protein
MEFEDHPPASGRPEAPSRTPSVVASPRARSVARLLRLRPRHGPRVTGEQVRDGLMIPRWALTLAILLTMLLFLALLVLFFLPADARASEADGINFDKPVKDWYKGPVRYIISRHEVKAYKALESDAERQNFIDWFWERHDIKQSTRENEWRDRFERRVLEATRMFSHTTKPGWKTDMGKIYILVGPPDEINSDLVAKTHRGIVTWVYRRPPFPDLPANTVIAFAGDTSGEYVLSSNPTLDADVSRWLKFAEVKRTADDVIMTAGHDPVLLNQGVPYSQTDLGTRMIFGRMQQLPPREEELFKSFVATKEFYGGIPIDSRLDYYQAGDGLTYMTLTVGVKSSSVQYRSKGGREIPDVAVFGKLISRSNPDEVISLASDSNFAEALGNANAGPDDLLVFQSTGGLKPGRYQVVIGVEDRVSKKVAAYRKDVEIPEFAAQTLTLSSITLAGEMAPTDYVAAGGKPFFLGRFRVVPRPDAAFKTSEDLNVYFQVYNPALDPETGTPRLDVSYTFRSKAPDGTFKELGTYSVKSSAGQVQGYAVPLAKWPPGDYEVAVTVADAVAGASQSATAGFVIRP